MLNMYDPCFKIKIEEYNFAIYKETGDFKTILMALSHFFNL